MQNKFVSDWGLIVALDTDGDVVWYYDSPDRISGIDRLKNGHLIYHLNNFETVEMDLLGNQVSHWYAENRPYPKPDNKSAIAIKNIQTLHHQPHETPRGTFLSFSANWRWIDNWYTSEYDPTVRKRQRVMGDTIIEFTKEGDVVWEWNAFDYFDVFQIGYEAFDPYWITRGFPDTWDWSHGNGVSYDPRDDSIVASFKLLDAIVKIDRKTKEIRWIFGDPVGWKSPLKEKLLKPVGDNFRWPYHHHNPRWTKDGTLLVFNNNRGQAKPFDGREQVPYERTYSHSVEYDIDQSNNTVRQVWVSEPELTADGCVSFAMSETHRLPKTNNMLEINGQCGPTMLKDISWNPWDLTKQTMWDMPRGARIREYTRADPAEVVFEARFNDPDQVLIWEVFGGFKSASFYEGADHD